MRVRAPRSASSLLSRVHGAMQKILACLQLRIVRIVTLLLRDSRAENDRERIVSFQSEKETVSIFVSPRQRFSFLDSQAEVVTTIARI